MDHQARTGSRLDQGDPQAQAVQVDNLVVVLEDSAVDLVDSAEEDSAVAGDAADLAAVASAAVDVEVQAASGRETDSAEMAPTWAIGRIEDGRASMGRLRL